MIWLLTLLLSFSFAHGDSSIEQIHALGGQVIEGSKPNTIYIAIGLSPLFVAADLEARLGHLSVARLPASGVADVVRGQFVMADGEDLLHHYFDYFLAPYIAAGAESGAQFEVLDWGYSGLSIESARRILGQYFLSKGIPSTQLHYAILTSRRTQIIDRNSDRVVLIDPQLSAQIKDRKFSELRSYKKILLDDWYVWFQNRHLFKSDLETAKPMMIEKIEASFLPQGEAAYQMMVENFRPFVCKSLLTGNSI